MPKEKFLTNRQKKFCELVLEGIYSNAECARRSGYSEGQANKTASLLLNGRDFPLVTEYLKELREIRERKYGVTVIGQLKRLAELSQGAEEKGQYSSAINAEKIRSSLGGLTVDRRETTHQIDKLSRDEIVARLSEIRKRYPSAFIEGDYKVVGSNQGEEKITSDLGDNTNS
tara:strand:+ start:1584 stop:2099 length:516 start_codon:yes stop_codon:yes gene_type:complete